MSEKTPHPQLAGTGFQLEYCTLTEKDLDAMMALLERDFVTRAPITSFLEKPEILLQTHQTTVKNALPHRTSIGAYNVTSGELVGMRLGSLGEDRTLEFEQETLLGKQLQAVIQALFDGEIKDILGTRNYIEYSLLCTKRELSNRGIADELYKRSHELAIGMGCEKAYIVGSNHYTGLLAKKYGYRTVRSIAYKDYIDPVTGKKIFKDIPKPHTLLSLAVKTLRRIPK